MLAYLFSQVSALLGSIESIKTKSVLNKYKAYEHVFYKSLILLLFSLPLLYFNWQLTLLGVFYIVYSIVIVYFNENFRANAIQNLEINTFTMLMSFSVFIVYGIELVIGREELVAKDVIGLLIFLVAIAIFLEVKTQEFAKINRVTLLNLLGTILIVSIDRSIGKTAFSEGWLSPEVAIAMRMMVLVGIFYFVAKRRGMILKGNLTEGAKDHWSIGFMKYSREFAYNYALMFGSAMMVTLVMTSSLFLTFIISGLFLADSQWKKSKLIGIVVAIIGIVVFQL